MCQSFNSWTTKYSLHLVSSHTYHSCCYWPYHSCLYWSWETYCPTVRRKRNTMTKNSTALSLSFPMKKNNWPQTYQLLTVFTDFSAAAILDAQPAVTEPGWLLLTNTLETATFDCFSQMQTVSLKSLLHSGFCNTVIWLFLPLLGLQQ